MNEKRERQDTYYLSKIYDPVMLYPDGRVGELTKKNVDVRVKLPSRVEGQERIGTMIQPRLAETAIHASLSEYLVGKTGNTSEKLPYRNSWRLTDMPAETLAAYEQWRDSMGPLDIDKIREVAAANIVSLEDRLNKSVPCPTCGNMDHQYACYTCGYARELYEYPLARYRDDEGVYDVPVDVADMIRLNPQALTHKTEWEIDDNGLMSGTRKIVFSAQAIPKEYVTGVKGDGVLVIDPADDLSKDVAFVTDRWAEGKKVSTSKRRTILRQNETPTTYTPESYLETLQNHVALHMYREQKDEKDYNAMIKGLHAAVGRRGLELAFQYKYMGMGDGEVRFMTAKRVDDYVVTQRIAGAFIAEVAIDDAVNQFVE